MYTRAHTEATTMNANIARAYKHELTPFDSPTVHVHIAHAQSKISIAFVSTRM